MMRFILALLAVLSGIVAAGQPVAARSCAAEAHAAQRIDRAVEAVNVQPGAALTPPDALPDLRVSSVAVHVTALLVPLRTVRIRCDRALE